jgi:hypothetical protein
MSHEKLEEARAKRTPKDKVAVEPKTSAQQGEEEAITSKFKASLLVPDNSVARSDTKESLITMKGHGGGGILK